MSLFSGHIHAGNACHQLMTPGCSVWPFEAAKSLAMMQFTGQAVYDDSAHPHPSLPATMHCDESAPALTLHLDVFNSLQDA